MAGGAESAALRVGSRRPLAGPAPPRVECATPGLPRRPLPPPHASPLSARRSWIYVGRGEARLPFMAESAAAALTTAAAGRVEQEAEPRAAGRCLRRGAGEGGGSPALAAAGAEEWAGPGGLGAGRPGKAGSPVACARVRL